MKKKKFDFDEVKVGEYFKYYGAVYIKSGSWNATNLKNGNSRSMFYGDMVIPVTVTIKVKEK